MRYLQFGIQDDNALERLQEIPNFERVVTSPLKRLNSLLGKINQHKSEALLKYAENLESRLEILTTKNIVAEKQLDLQKYLNELTNLRQYPKLAELAVNYILEALNLPEDKDWFSETLEVTQGVYLRAFLSARYYNILTLTETIDRSEAIVIYKLHFEKTNREWVAENEERFQNLEEFFEDTANKDPTDSGWLGLVGEVDNGKVLVRKDTCLWADAMAEFPDYELKFLVCCYGDYTSIKVSNRHFELTMEHSIAGGHGFCDCVIHDTRINDDLNHPSDEFFANLKPST